MRIKKSNLFFTGFLVFTLMIFCLNFFFFSKPDSIELKSNYSAEETATNNESTLEVQLAEELAQFSPYELKQVMMNQF